MLLGDCASPMATPASCGGLLLPALVLAAERIAASNLAVPAARALRVLGQSSRETSAVKKAGRASAGGRGCCDVAGWIDQFRIGSRRRERPGGADHCTLVPERQRSRLAAGFRFDRLAFRESAALGGALAGGFVGTVVLTSGLRAGSELRLTRIDRPFLLGTALFSDRTRAKAAHTSRTSPSDSLLGQLRTRGA
jgi:hypothetical protein